MIEMILKLQNNVSESMMLKSVQLSDRQTAMPVLEVTSSLIGWFCLYLLFYWTFSQRGPEWNCRLVTLTHGVVIVLLTAYVLFIDGPWPFTHAGQCYKVHMK